MSEQELEKLKYPIGRFIYHDSFSEEEIKANIRIIESFPENLSQEVINLSGEQLNTAYRPDGWTIRQVVHHCADSHINSIIRFKLALTEDNPVIKPYKEDKWAELIDSKLPVDVSLQLLKALHYKWVVLLRSLTIDDLNKSFIHPEKNNEIRLDQCICMYAWHCNHHLAHIKHLKKAKGW